MHQFEWDGAKAEQIRLKHGIGFEDAAQALLDLALMRPSPYGDENRFTSLCECNGRVIVVVWTPRDRAIRIISARPAGKNEKVQYYQNVRRSASPREH